jgi:hypothetical protein
MVIELLKPLLTNSREGNMADYKVKKLDRSRFKKVSKPTQTEQRALDYFQEVNDRYSAQDKVQSK